MREQTLERRFLRRPRLRPFQLTLVILVAGWVPSVLMAFIAYSILRDTLESRILNEEFTLARGVAQLIDFDLIRNGEVMEYYQTLPRTREVIDLADSMTAEEWLATIYYSHPRIDGMFLTNAKGELVGSLPPAPQFVGKDFMSAHWMEGALQSRTFYISPVHPRLADDRMVSAIVVAVRNPRNPTEIFGYLGAQILTERIGRRLSSMDFGEDAKVEIIDQKGFPLFAPGFVPNGPDVPVHDSELVARLRDGNEQFFEDNGVLYIADPLEAARWITVLERPAAVAYRSIYQLVSWMGLLAGILVIGTALVGRYFGRLYGRQLIVTERIEREMIFSEKILANMPIGIALIDANSKRLLTANDRFLDLAAQFGNLPGEVGGENLSYDDLNLAGGEALERVLNFGTPFQAVEEKVLSKEGNEHFLTVNLLRLQDSTQRTQGVLYLVEDNTADRRLREQLIAANTAKDHFLAALSHELRNPLSPVITMTEELERLSEGSKEMRSAVDVIRRNVQLEARLIDDLLDITRITNGKLQLNREWTDAHKAIRSAVEICQVDLADKKLSLDLRLDAEQHYLFADPARLQQVFWNLLKNAVKFTPEGGTIEISSSNETHAHGVGFVAHCKDSGIGIEADQLDRIFHAFEQGETATSRRFGGLGLGLAISRAMVGAHGGTLEAQSKGWSHGATFRIWVPKAEARPADPVGRILIGRGNQGPSVKTRVLLVDDHVDTCVGLELLLKRHGFETRTAHTVSQALEAAAPNPIPFDLLLSDLGLPDGSGLDLLKQLKAKGFQGPSIAVSGYGMEADLLRSKEAGFDIHLIKPVDIDRLLAAMNRLLKNSKK